MDGVVSDLELVSKIKRTISEMVQIDTAELGCQLLTQRRVVEGIVECIMRVNTILSRHLSNGSGSPLSLSLDRSSLEDPTQKISEEIAENGVSIGMQLMRHQFYLCLPVTLARAIARAPLSLLAGTEIDHEGECDGAKISEQEVIALGYVVARAAATEPLLQQSGIKLSSLRLVRELRHSKLFGIRVWVGAGAERYSVHVRGNKSFWSSVALRCSQRALGSVDRYTLNRSIARKAHIPWFIHGTFPLSSLATLASLKPGQLLGFGKDAGNQLSVSIQSVWNTKPTVRLPLRLIALTRPGCLQFVAR